ncbi:SPOR domain-containing protein, partial [Capnocytophaga catalasegens]|uniref:SPOR domain-containing protein n=1 Tax=Capnocytophaga catalasegens TaxID=1004260 RepID=UPI00222E64FF
IRKKQAQEKALEKQQTTTQVTQQPQVVETRKESTTSSTQTVQSVKNTSGYHLIAGAFSTEQNANTRVKQLQDSGYANASIVGKNARGLFLVAYKSFNAQSDANAYKQELNSKGVESWVYISK